MPGRFILLLLGCFAAVAEPSLQAAQTSEEARVTIDGNELVVAQKVFRKSISTSYLLKYDPDGKLLARRRLGRGVFTRTLQAAPGGDVYLAADLFSRGSLRGFRSLNRANGYSAFVARLDPDLQFRWVQPFKGGGVTGGALDSGTNLVVVGGVAGEVSIGGLTATNGNSANAAFRCVISPEGEPQSLWVTDQRNVTVWRTMIAEDSIYVGGFSSSNPYNPASFGGGSTNLLRTNCWAYVASYSLDGAFRWVALMEDSRVMRFNYVDLFPMSAFGADIYVKADFSRLNEPGGIFVMTVKADGTVLSSGLFFGPFVPPP
jgi:hypothetical protein